METTTLDELFTAWAKSVGMVMDTDADREDFATRGHLHTDPGSDLND